MSNRPLIAAVVLLCAGFAFAAEDDTYEAKLKAGREAAYKRYLVVASAKAEVKTPDAAAGSKPAVASPAVVATNEAPASPGAVILAPRSSRHIFAGYSTPYAFGDLRYNLYDNLNLYRRQRWTDYPVSPYIYQPLWDWRYRRSWPRPVVVRDYVKSHWLWDGQRYTYVPGHAEYETHWVVQGWPRYHWRGSHYSVSVSFNR